MLEPHPINHSFIQRLYFLHYLFLKKQSQYGDNECVCYGILEDLDCYLCLVSSKTQIVSIRREDYLILRLVQAYVVIEGLIIVVILLRLVRVIPRVKALDDADDREQGRKDESEGHNEGPEGGPNYIIGKDKREKSNLTILNDCLILEIIDDRVRKDDEARDAKDGLDREAAPVGPEGRTPIPLTPVVHFDEGTNGNQKPEYCNNLSHELQGRVAWCFLN